jgi:hypothetical protein
MTFRDGEIVWDLNARDAAEYGDLPFNAGVREGEYIIPPDR